MKELKILNEEIIDGISEELTVEAFCNLFDEGKRFFFLMDQSDLNTK